MIEYSNWPAILRSISNRNSRYVFAETLHEASAWNWTALPGAHSPHSGSNRVPAVEGRSLRQPSLGCLNKERSTQFQERA